ncbi:uncharacterized protein LOC108034111 [Drosophila biarmipes]|uniref:uncharacterized protein LOC108034111 n=1 Tax=Drosophila biarmipes TaxID=125945 RepID=UPI0007E63BBA|nr:uncharacterized protein LOC108034111 [Drosophila biarmipes]
MDCLQQVAQQLADLKGFYTRDWPKYCKEYYCLDSFQELYQRDAKLKDVQVYALPNLELGLFVIVDRYQISVGSLEAESFERVLKESLVKLPFYGGEQFASMPQRYLKVALDVIQAKNIKLGLNYVTYSLVLSKEEALYFYVEPPVGFSLKPLEVDDAQVVDDHWEWREPGSLPYIRRQISCTTSVGLFKDEDNELVAWCIRAQDGLLAALQVKAAYQRRGFGAIIVKEFSRREAEQGRDIITEVSSENQPSLNLFKKLGFRYNDQCHWLLTEAPNKD